MFGSFNSTGKTHYAQVELGNESNPHDEWGVTACGLEYTESPLDNNWGHVTCKNCLKRTPTLSPTPANGGK